jgi:methyl coenzyme M reductase alpha subunit
MKTSLLVVIKAIDVFVTPLWRAMLLGYTLIGCPYGLSIDAAIVAFLSHPPEHVMTMSKTARMLPSGRAVELLKTPETLTVLGMDDLT